MAPATKRKPTRAELDKFDLAYNFHDPSGAALPPGLRADSTYQAFMRGIGANYQQAAAATLQQMAAARAAYVTQKGRLPGELEQNIEQVNDNHDVWFSGERLQKVARERLESQQKAEDLIAARAAAITGARQGFGSKVSELGMSQADAVGQLQARLAQQANQDKYIKAVAGANAAAAAGSGTTSYSVSLPGGTAPGAAGGTNPAAPIAPDARPGTPGGPAAPGQKRVAGPPSAHSMLPFAPYQQGTSRMAYFQGMDPKARTAFGQFLHFTGGGKYKSEGEALNSWLSEDPAYRNAQRAMAGPSAPAPARRYGLG